MHFPAFNIIYAEDCYFQLIWLPVDFDFFRIWANAMSLIPSHLWVTRGILKLLWDCIVTFICFPYDPLPKVLSRLFWLLWICQANHPLLNLYYYSMLLSKPGVYLLSLFDISLEMSQINTGIICITHLFYCKSFTLFDATMTSNVFTGVSGSSLLGKNKDYVYSLFSQLVIFLLVKGGHFGYKLIFDCSQFFLFDAIELAKANFEGNGFLLIGYKAPCLSSSVSELKTTTQATQGTSGTSKRKALDGDYDDTASTGHKKPKL